MPVIPEFKILSLISGQTDSWCFSYSAIKAGSSFRSRVKQYLDIVQKFRRFGTTVNCTKINGKKQKKMVKILSGGLISFNAGCSEIYLVQTLNDSPAHSRGGLFLFS